MSQIQPSHDLSTSRDMSDMSGMMCGRERNATSSTILHDPGCAITTCLHKNKIINILFSGTKSIFLRRGNRRKAIQKITFSNSLTHFATYLFSIM